MAKTRLSQVTSDWYARARAAVSGAVSVSIAVRTAAKATTSRTSAAGERTRRPMLLGAFGGTGFRVEPTFRAGASRRTLHQGADSGGTLGGGARFGSMVSRSPSAGSHAVRVPFTPG